MPLHRRLLIVNADDFGLSLGVNAGIIEAHERGIVTSASLMVRGPAATQAADYALQHPALSVGLHLDLAEWTFADEEWRPAYQVVPLDDATAVAQEIARQLAVFRNLMGRDPTHLDSHQHVHRSEPIATILQKTSFQMGVILRATHPQVHYRGDFYGQSDKGYSYPEGITVEALLQVLQQLPPGCTELGCHPGKGTDMGGTYCQERQLECATLCEPRVRAALDSGNIVLCSFSNWREALG
jgi:chitin disaccharide deacetylase